MMLKEALTIAETYWAGRKGSRCMGIFAAQCVDILGPHTQMETLNGPRDGSNLLATLRAKGLSAQTVKVYYNAFKRVVAINGGELKGWPSAPNPPRKTREAISYGDLQRVIGYLYEKRQSETAWLCEILYATGMRVAVEALSPRSTQYREGDLFGVLHITGKGGHERLIPVWDDRGRRALCDPIRMGAIRAIPYATHLRRWTTAVKALGVNSKLATFHAIRHLYACEALKKSGGNIYMAKELLGHSNIRTTEGYLSVTLEDKAAALMPSNTIQHMETTPHEK